MAENIIYYGPPGTSKTFLLQAKMSDYTDYNVTDEQIRDAYVQFTEPWVLVAMVLLQHQGRMRTSEVQSVIDRVGFAKRVDAAVVTENHSTKASPLGLERKQPRVFFPCDDGTWYVDRLRVQQYLPDFFERFLTTDDTIRRYRFVTFHQSFSYEDFIEGIRPAYVKETNSIDYSPKPGVFKELCAEAKEHKEKEYAIFIDEINRGNISEILGELISLIEVDKRQGMANELSATLPYSKETFVVPSNVNIYGTMNSADRSVGAIDMALRRRFEFVSMYPSSDIIANELELNGVDPHDVDGVDLIRMFDIMNGRIELLLDRNHMLGHAMFMSVRTGQDIVDVVRDRIVPLLEEYFFKELDKVQLVFNDLDENGDLRDNPVYGHSTLSADDYFDYVGDYLIDDVRHYAVNKQLNLDSIRHIYGE